ncbi:MAG: PDZ domain-containing protein [Pirellulales bacterium]
MPATESTWRKLSLLHVLFGVSSVAMLGVMVWMFVADHNREWKKYQVTSMNLEQFMIEQRIAEQNNATFREEAGKLKGAVAVAQYRGWYADAAAVKPLFDLLDEAAEKQAAKFSVADVKKTLQDRMDATNRAREDLTTTLKTKGANVDATLAAAIASGAKSETVDKFDAYLAARTNYLLAIDDLAAKLKFSEDNLSLEVKAQTAAQGKAAGDRDMAINGGAPADTIAKFERQYAEETQKLDGGYLPGIDPTKTPDLKPVIGLRKSCSKLKRSAQLQSQTALIGAQEAVAKKAYDDQQNQLTQLNKTLYERANNGWKTALGMPIIDAFGSPFTPKQIWLPELPQKNGSFPDVARFDRCVTCHTGIAATAAGSAVEPAYPNSHSFSVTLDLGVLPIELRKTVVEARLISAGDSTRALIDLSKLDPATLKAVADALKIQLDASKTNLAVIDVEKLDAELKAKVVAAKLDPTAFDTVNRLLAESYGFSLAEKGLFQVNDPTISVIYPQGLAAQAGLSMGDVITGIGSTDVTTRTVAEATLLDSPQWASAGADGAAPKIPVRLTVRRGVPQPYCSHPRMDLFVGDLSPHPVGKFGCTICHQGQGSATQFKWSSHTPNNKVQENKWIQDYGWFNNHHWITPMLPDRFEQASCLKCHHDVIELQASVRFPDPPAEKLVHGYETIREYGCFGCHEINGFDGPKRRLGPDMRVEPQFYAAAEQLMADPGLKDLAPNAVKLAKTVAMHPEDDAARRALQLLITTDAETAAKAKDPAVKPKLSADSFRLAALLKDVESPGQIRKVGPSLRHVAQKVGYEFLYDWIRNPRDFRPTTKMPRFFGVTDHLDGPQLEKTDRYESLEIRGMTEFLLAKSQTYEQIKPATGVEPGSVERGKKAFETRGCLACHAHDEFPQSHAHQGPNLSRIAEKLSLGDAAHGKAWLYSWVREPNLYHNRTVMPNLFLETEDARTRR